MFKRGRVQHVQISKTVWIPRKTRIFTRHLNICNCFYCRIDLHKQGCRCDYCQPKTLDQLLEEQLEEHYENLHQQWVEYMCQ